MKPNPYTGTSMTQREERLHVRRRAAEVMAARGTSRETTFREKIKASAREVKHEFDTPP